LPKKASMQYWVYYSTQLCFGFLADRIGQLEIICIGGLPVMKRHIGGTCPQIFYMIHRGGNILKIVMILIKANFQKLTMIATSSSGEILQRNGYKSACEPWNCFRFENVNSRNSSFYQKDTHPEWKDDITLENKQSTHDSRAFHEHLVSFEQTDLQLFWWAQKMSLKKQSSYVQ